MSIIRSCLQSLIKNDPEVSQRLCVCVPHFVGVGDSCLFSPSDPDEFNLILECPTDAIAYHLDLALPNHIDTLALAIPAVEIWIEGPSYGGILSLKPVKVLNSGEEIVGENDMVSATIERTNEAVAPSPVIAEEVIKQVRSTLSLRALATAINRSEKELYPIMGEMRLSLLPQSDGSLAINRQDAAAIVLRWAEKIDEERVDYVEHSQRAATDAINAPSTPKRERQSRTRAGALNGEAAIGQPEAPRLIEYKPRLTARDIKDKAVDTFKAIIDKVHNLERTEVVQGIISENEIGQEIMSDVQQLFNKKKPGGRVNLYLNKFREAAAEEMKTAAADSSQTAA